VWKGVGGEREKLSTPATFIIMELKKKIPGFDETFSANSLQILGRVGLT
jgi:hypothetical protein